MSEELKEPELGPDEETEDTLRGRYLLFSAGEAIFAVAISAVQEIVGMQHTTTLPESQPYLRGVINLRGNVLPVIDVRLKLGLPGREYDDRTCIIIVNGERGASGLIVDTVCEVCNIPYESISPPPHCVLDQASDLLHGVAMVNDEPRMILNLERLLAE